MDEPARHLYRLALPAQRIVEPPSGFTVRSVNQSDDAALAALMEAAYAGTVDEHLGGNSDGDVEIRQWRSGGADPIASVVLDDDEGTLLSAALVTALAPDTALLAYVITDPDWKRQGLATAATSMALVELALQDVRLVIAGITEGNIASERLLARFGFERMR